MHFLKLIFRDLRANVHVVVPSVYIVCCFYATARRVFVSDCVGSARHVAMRRDAKHESHRRAQSFAVKHACFILLMSFVRIKHEKGLQKQSF